jgi:hypothetical protein
MGRPAARLAAALLLAASAAGCAGGTSLAPVHSLATLYPEAQGLVRSELHFGRRRPDGRIVSDAEWRAFVADHVTPRFPDGFTVLDAAGQWRERTGLVISEPTKVLVIVHEPVAQPVAAIQELRAVYKRLFDQESVLLVAVPARVGF